MVKAMTRNRNHQKIMTTHDKAACLMQCGFVQMKVWRIETAQRLGISESALAMRLTRKKINPLRVEINKRLVFVKGETP